VAADRTFRSFLRAARSAGMALPQALRKANQQTLARTGMNMLEELGVEPAEMEQQESAAPDTLPPELRAVVAWAEAAEFGRLYALAEILMLAAGISDDSPAGRRIAGRMGQLLRGLGFRRVRMRVEGASPRNFWMK